MTDKKPKCVLCERELTQGERFHKMIVCDECFEKDGADKLIFEQGKFAGKKELAKTILSEGYAVADKRYIAFEVERLKSQQKGAKK